MIKTILVPICHEQGADERVEYAIELANKFDAHIKVLHILTPLTTMVSGTHADFTYSIEAYNAYQIEAEKEAENLKKKYETKLNNSGVRFDWCQEKGDLVSQLYIYSRTSDISIISQKGDSFDVVLDYMNDFIIGSGLPVIAIPKKGVKDISIGNILIAWDGSRECARAAHDALPLLKLADKVTVLTVSDDKNIDVPEADICIHLARHSVNTEALTLSNRVPTSQRIIETAESTNADLIVAGAWGHKRLREIIFGGVTKTLLSNQKRAVFITH